MPVPAAPASEPPAAAAAQQAPDSDSLDPTYYPPEQLDESPRLLGEVRQIYPEHARKGGVEGFVTLLLLINEHGEVDEINVVKSQPIGFFEEPAISMFRGHRFTPAIRHGKAVRSRWLKTVRFQSRD